MPVEAIAAMGHALSTSFLQVATWIMVKTVEQLRIDKSPWGLGYPRGLEVRSCVAG
jgi:hypothetical protein